MTREWICHKCKERNDQYWIAGKYRWPSNLSGDRMRGWDTGGDYDPYSYEPTKTGYSAICEDCQEERSEKRFFAKLKKATANCF